MTRACAGLPLGWMTRRWPAWRVVVLSLFVVTAIGWRTLRPLLEAYAVQVHRFVPTHATQHILRSRIGGEGEFVPAWSIWFGRSGELAPVVSFQVVKPGVSWGNGLSDLEVHVLGIRLEKLGRFLTRDVNVETSCAADWDDDGNQELPLLVHVGRKAAGWGTPAKTRFCVVRVKAAQTEVVAIADDLATGEAWLVGALPKFRERTVFGGAAYPFVIERVWHVPWARAPAASAPSRTAADGSTPLTNGELGRLRWTRRGGTLRAVGTWAPEMRVYTPPIDQPWVLPADMTIQDFIEKIIAEVEPQTPEVDW